MLLSLSWQNSCLGMMRRTVRAGDRTGVDLITQPPVSLLHKKANDSDSVLPSTAEFLLLLAPL